jgi:hypothetical protein
VRQLQAKSVYMRAFDGVPVIVMAMMVAKGSGYLGMEMPKMQVQVKNAGFLNSSECLVFAGVLLLLFKAGREKKSRAECKCGQKSVARILE